MKYWTRKTTSEPDPDLIPENIKAGVDILGVVGTLQSPLLENGFTQFKTGIVTIASTTTMITIPHAMGVTPKAVVVLKVDNVTGGSIGFMVINDSEGSEEIAGVYSDGTYTHGYCSQDYSITLSTSQLKITNSTGGYNSSGSSSILTKVKYEAGDYQWFAFY